MTISVSSPITGAAQTGFTSPTYTVTLDQANLATEKQWFVSALGGTQVGVRTHGISDPFTITFARPSILKTLSGLISGLTGLYGKVPSNVWNKACLVRKGVNIASNNVPRVASIRVITDIPAGSDSFDPANVRALYSAAIGVLQQQSAAMGDAGVTGAI